MDRNIRDLLLSSERGLKEPQGEVKVLVALSVADPDETCLDDLRSLGLQVDEVIRNKIVGSIRQDLVAALEAHENVAEVEPSVPLGLHS